MSKSAYIGIDLGGTNIKFGLVDARARIITRGAIATADSRRRILAQFAAIAAELHAVARAGGYTVRTIGVGSPGIVDIRRGKVVGGSPNVVQWRGTDIRRSLESVTGMRVYADNDANVMALAEHRYGAGKGYSTGLYITVGTGLGSGIILNNQIWRGARYAGAEVGHSIINLDGLPCQCGKRGCLEVYVNAASFARFYGKPVPRGAGSKFIFDRARAGDRKAINAIRTSANYLAIGLGSAVEILNPEIIVIGGGVAAGGRLYFDAIRSGIRRYASAAQLKALKILPAQLGNDAGFLGAALLPLEPEFQ
ncbi:MAG: ROK family protein [candidate division Zixibacteria bacterium]|nr:ROK family protein [candidate division Zixibacteria bacterium]